MHHIIDLFYNNFSTKRKHNTQSFLYFCICMNKLIKNVTILDPTSPFHEAVVDVQLENNKITNIGNQLVATENDTVIDGSNSYLSQGWVDIMADYADPGYEYKETLITGSKAAQNGGFSDVFLVPNTNPAVLNKGTVEYIKNASNKLDISVYPIGAVSKNLEGKDLAEMMDMYHAGAIAFSDGWNTINNAQLLLKALEYVSAFKGVILQLPVYESLYKGGLMHEGENSVKWGMPGIPTIAETLQIHRDIELLRYTQSRLHITGISTKEGLALIKAAKAEGLDITCSVTPYHLLYTDAELGTYDSNFKVTPPLRSEADRLALIEGVKDGTVDVIVSHHKPQEWDSKAKEYEYTADGMMTQETMLAMLIKAAPEVSIATWVEKLTTNPRRIFGLAAHKIDVNEQGHYTLISPDHTWTFDKSTKQSKGINSPLYNTALKGKATII